MKPQRATQAKQIKAKLYENISPNSIVRAVHAQLKFRSSVAIFNALREKLKLSDHRSDNCGIADPTFHNLKPNIGVLTKLPRKYTLRDFIIG